MTKKLCFYVEGDLNIIDTASNEGISFYQKENIQQVKERYPKAELVPFDYALERINEATKEKYPMLNPQEITEEQFYEMFECLPPMHLETSENGMSFKMSEMTFCDITNGYVKKNNKYYSMNCRTKTKHNEMIAVCN